MLRLNVSYEEIRDIANALSARGEKPTISRVKEELGGRGSSVTISTYLKQWRGVDDSSMTNDLFNIEPIVLHQEPKRPEHLVEPPLAKVQSQPISEPTPTYRSEAFPPQYPLEQGPREQAVTATESTMPSNKTEEDRFQNSSHQAERHSNKDRRPPSFERHHNKQQGGGRHADRPFRENRGGDRDRGYRNNNGAPPQQHQQQAHSDSVERSEQGSEKISFTPLNYWTQYDYVFHGNLAEKSDRELEIIIRRLESLLSKEQSRRETAEKLFEETKEYASSLRKQVADRINDVNQAHEAVIAELKAQARDLKISAERDLMFYRDQLGKANQKIMELLKGQVESNLCPEQRDESHFDGGVSE